jgi:hypothetical protein
LRQVFSRKIFGEFLDKTGLIGLPNRSDRFPLPVWGSNRSGLTSFRNWPDRFGLPAAVSCVFPLRVSSGCWLGLLPRSSSTSLPVWTWQEKLVEVHEWSWVHMPNSWIDFLLSAPIHSPLSGSSLRSFRSALNLMNRAGGENWTGALCVRKAPPTLIHLCLVRWTKMVTNAGWFLGSAGYKMDWATRLDGSRVALGHG